MSEPKDAQSAIAEGLVEKEVCAIPDCNRHQSGRVRACLEHDAEYDTAAELKAWEWTKSLLIPWMQTVERIGSPEFEQVMKKALDEVNDNVERARGDWEKAKAKL